jgi:hypothetical protein
VRQCFLVERFTIPAHAKLAIFNPETFWWLVPVSPDEREVVGGYRAIRLRNEYLLFNETNPANGIIHVIHVVASKPTFGQPEEQGPLTDGCPNLS